MFRYEVTYWDEDNFENNFEKGLVSAANYGDAANYIVDYYGQENIVDIKLYELERILTDEDVEESIKANNED